MSTSIFTPKFAKELESFFQWTILHGYIIKKSDSEQSCWNIELTRDFEEPGRNKLECYIKTLFNQSFTIHLKQNKINDAKLLVKDFKEKSTKIEKEKSTKIEKSEKITKIEKSEKITKEKPTKITKEKDNIFIDKNLDTTKGYYLDTLPFTSKQLTQVFGQPVKTGTPEDEHVFEWKISSNKNTFSIYDWENNETFEQCEWHISGKKNTQHNDIITFITNTLQQQEQEQQQEEHVVCELSENELEFELSDIEN